MKLKLRILLLHKIKEEADQLTSVCQEKFPEVSILPFTNSSFSGDLIEELRPQFLFLDINLTQQDEKNEKSLRAAIKKNKLKVVLLTKKSRITNQSIRYNTIDYLNVPLKRNELIEVFNNLKSELDLENEKIDLSKNKLKLKTRTETFFIDLQNVIYLQSNGNYIDVHTDNSSFSMYASLKDFENKLNDNFQKVNRGCIVNMSMIKKFVHTEGGYLLLWNDHKVAISRRKKADFLNKLNLHFLSQN